MDVDLCTMSVKWPSPAGGRSKLKVCSRAGAHTRDIPRYIAYVKGRRLSRRTRRGLLAQAFGHRVSTHCQVLSIALQCENA